MAADLSKSKQVQTSPEKSKRAILKLRPPATELRKPNQLKTGNPGTQAGYASIGMAWQVKRGNDASQATGSCVGKSESWHIKKGNPGTPATGI